MKCFPFREGVFQTKKRSHQVDVLEPVLMVDIKGENVEF
ncbi:hypothetical protein BH23THE1_BH23THE1_05890 [soil metagenome]